MRPVIALVVTPGGFPLVYGEMPGNTRDQETLGEFLRKIEEQYGQAERIWVMDRGIPSEQVLAEMRARDRPMRYWSSSRGRGALALTSEAAGVAEACKAEGPNGAALPYGR